MAEREHHEHSRLTTEDRGIVARCECGWVSGYHISSLAACDALMEHREGMHREDRANAAIDGQALA